MTRAHGSGATGHFQASSSLGSPLPSNWAFWIIPAVKNFSTSPILLPELQPPAGTAFLAVNAAGNPSFRILTPVLNAGVRADDW